MKKKILAITIAVVLCLSALAFTACGETEEPTDGVTVTSLKDITSYPYTNYLPGEVFDITGLAIKVNLSNGRTRKYFDTDFTEWTHKGEPLTEDVTKITVKLPDDDFTFDIDIFVGIPLDSTILVDASSVVGNYYYAGTAMDFSAISVKYYANGIATDLSPSEWRLYDGDKRIEDISDFTAEEGKHTFTVKYLSDYKSSFDVQVYPASRSIFPRRIEAEECAYETSIAHTNGEGCTGQVTDNCPAANDLDWDKLAEDCSATTSAEYVAEDGTVQTKSVPKGASGRGAVGSLAAFQNGKLRYFKFKVTVATEGYYDIYAAMQPSSYTYGMGGVFTINVNRELDGDKFLYRATDVSGGIAGGNRLTDYVEAGTYPDGTPVTYTSYLNSFWQTEVKISTVRLNAGENEIRLRMPNGFNGNIDYFEVRGADERNDPEPLLWSMRNTNADGARVKTDVTDGTVYLQYGQTLSEICNTPDNYPFKFTLLLLRLPDGNIVAVGEHMLSAIDYNKLGEQNVTIVCKTLNGTLQAITTFKLFIYRRSE